MAHEFMFEFRCPAPPGKEPTSKANIKQLHEGSPVLGRYSRQAAALNSPCRGRPVTILQVHRAEHG